VNRWWYAALAWVGVIFFSSTSLASQWCERAFAFLSELLLGRKVVQQPSFDLVHLLADKGLHVAMFLILAMLLWRALPAGPFRAWQILVLGLIVGSCSEFLQRFFPGRDPAIRDVLINLGGTALGVASSSLAASRWRSSTVASR
jgi:VanZ family protein